MPLLLYLDATDRVECCKRENVRPLICQQTCELTDDEIMVTLMPGEPENDEWEKICPCAEKKNPEFAKCFPNLTLGNFFFFAKNVYL